MKLPPLTDNLSDARAHLDAFGVALLTDQISPDALRVARQATYAAAEEDRQQRRQNPDFALDLGDRNVRIWNLLNRDPIFCGLVQLPSVIELLRGLIGWPALLGNFSANIALPDSGGGVLHADQGYMPQPWPPKPQGMNVAFILDDFTADNGATEVIPGSHNPANHRPPEQTPIPVTAPAGTLMIFESRVWHRTGRNHTESPRAALFGWYTKPIYRTQENWFLSLDRDVVASASETLLTLLAYRTEGFGLVYGRSPR